MRRLGKWLGIGVGALAAVVVLTALLIPSLVNLERYRTLVAQRAGRALGREVSMGALRVSVWRGIGAEARGIRIGQTPGYGDEPFLAAESLRLHVQVLPLLRGQVKVSSAVLERPRIRIVRDSSGRWSLTDLVKSHPAQGRTRSPAATPRLGKVPMVGGLLLSEVTVYDGEVTLAEQAERTADILTLADVNGTARQGDPADPIDVTARARLAGTASGHVQATWKVRLGDQDGPRGDGTVSFTGLAPREWERWFPGSRGAPIVSGSVSGEVRLEASAGHTTFAGSVDLTPTALQVGDTFRKPPGENARITFQGQRNDTALRIEKVSVFCRDNALEGTVHLPDIRVPRLSFTASSTRIDLDRLLAVPTKQVKGGSGLAWAASSARSGASTPGPVSPKANGRVSIGELSYQGLTWNAVEADVRYEGGVVRLPALRADFARGRLRAHGEVDLRPSVPRVSLTSRLEKAATEPLVKALAKDPWTLKSGIDFDGTVEFTGLALPEILGSAAGNGSVRLVSGRLIDYKPLDRLAELVTPILVAHGVRVRLNEFDEVTGHYTVDNGILRTTDLILTKPEGTVTAAGTVSLLDASLDFDVVAKFDRATVEAKVTGTTAEPIVVPKLARFQRRIENELDKVLPEEQSRGLKDLLRGLFRR